MVHQTMVRGVPHEQLVDVCCAFVEPALGTECTSASLTKACRGSIANYKTPRQVVVTEEFPRTTTNKIMRDALQAETVNWRRVLEGPHMPCQLWSSCV
jgi:acyl-coenzyme A synthetase/AMP-(fatty) acid ligase